MAILFTTMTADETMDGDAVQLITDGTDAHFSADGRYVVFASAVASNIEIFRTDLLTGEVVRVSTSATGGQADSNSYQPQISADGRYVVFLSDATNLVAGDTNVRSDIFRKDLVTGEIVRVSTSASSGQANNDSYRPQISADGRYVVFTSDASDLVAGDTNVRSDIFRKDLQTGEIIRVSTSATGAQASGYSDYAQISADGRYVVFESNATNLVAGDTQPQIGHFPQGLADRRGHPRFDRCDGGTGERRFVRRRYQRRRALRGVRQRSPATSSRATQMAPGMFSARTR